MPSSSVVIIGGGVMGCAVALRLAQRGLAPLLLERSVPGAEASSAAAGILAPQQEAEAPGPLFDLSLESRARWPAFAEELESLSGIEIGFRRSGVLAIAPPGDEEAEQRLASRAAWQSARGLDVERLDAVEARRLEPSLGALRSALRLPDEAQVEPPRLMRALQLAAARAGVRFLTAWVRRIVLDGAGARVTGVEVEDRRIDTDRVVLAAGSWSSLVDGTRLPPRAVRPLRGQLVELETRPAPFSHVLFSVGAGGGYLVPRDDGRIVVGSTMEEVGYRKDVTASGLSSLLGVACRTVPALAAAPVLRFWANFRPTTSDHLPLLGAAPASGLFVATGHFRNGILLTPVTADALAALVCDEAPPVDLAPFACSRLPVEQS